MRLFTKRAFRVVSVLALTGACSEIRATHTGLPDCNGNGITEDEWGCVESPACE